MKDNRPGILTESYQYQEECDVPSAIEMMYYLFLCHGYNGEMED